MLIGAHNRLSCLWCNSRNVQVPGRHWVRDAVAALHCLRALLLSKAEHIRTHRLTTFGNIFAECTNEERHHNLDVHKIDSHNAATSMQILKMDFFLLNWHCFSDWWPTILFLSCQRRQLTTGTGQLTEDMPTNYLSHTEECHPFRLHPPYMHLQLLIHKNCIPPNVRFSIRPHAPNARLDMPSQWCARREKSKRISSTSSTCYKQLFSPCVPVISGGLFPCLPNSNTFLLGATRLI